MKRFWALLTLALAASLHAAVPTGSLEAFLAEEMQEAGAPGVSYGIAEDGEITTGQAGTKRLGTITPVLEESGFLIGSVSKGFTALAVMQLVEAGQVRLDAPIGDYLGVFSGNDEAAAITIRQLLSHTSGFSTYQGNLSQSDFSVDANALARRVESVAAMQPEHPAGTVWDYSNANYMLLGRLIEQVSGLTYTQYMAANVFETAGLTDTYVHVGPGDSRLAAGHEPWLISKHVIQTNKMGIGSAPQGGIVSTGGDLARYMAIMMNGEDDVISAASKTLMMTPASEVSPEYGFGWFIDTDKGTVFHSGVSPGFEALATMIPAQRKGVAVLVNAGSGLGYGDTGHLRQGLSARAIGLDYDGGRPGWGPKGAFLFFMIAPFAFVLATIWALLRKRVIRAKTGAMRLISLWVPVVTTAALAVGVFFVLPQVVGAPLGAIRAFQPDLALGFVASAVFGLIWSFARLVIGYTGPAKP